MGRYVHVLPQFFFFPSGFNDVPDRRDAMNNQSKKGVASSFQTALVTTTRLIRRLAID